MVLSTSTSPEISWHEQAYQLLIANKYIEVANLYEQAIAIEPEIQSHYWYLGLAYLLQGYEEEAQVTWMSAMVEGISENLEESTGKLIQILETEALRQLDLDNLQTSWLIRQHTREITPTFINNLLHLIQLSIHLGDFTPERLTEWQVATVLKQTKLEELDSILLLEVLKKLVEYTTPETLEFAEACIPHYTNDSKTFINTLLLAAVKLSNKYHQSGFAAQLTELCLQLNPEHPESLWHLCCFYSLDKSHQKAKEIARTYDSYCSTIAWKVLGNYVLLRSSLMAGAWLEAESEIQSHKNLIKNLVQNPPEELEPSFASRLFIANFFLPYLQDNPHENRWLQIQVAQLLYKSYQTTYNEFVESPWNNQREVTRKLKIGYIAHTLRNHSVGWLSRWLFQYCDRESFQTNLYLILQASEDCQWLENQVDFVYNFDAKAPEIAAKIKEDGIDILVDLDSLTLDITCQVLALKPAPVQVTWLGWDATGIPGVDYFIADPYVLPENAQEYYTETIWRLPHTYVAVDGFEVGVPTLRREQLEIPSDAVIYFSSQIGYKRHPDTVRLQMRILKQVPNSYLLIKGMADETTIQQFFTQIAESEGVAPDRLRYLPIDASEYVHRANLGCADIVLDTYPYSGATTTLETLWMGVPLVTRVGQQFSARNSYAFMMNAGITEGIAWTDEEYVEWGVRLGKDASLRQQVSWKMRQSRQTSPLWNAKQFTQEMEKAYKQMWQKYSCLSLSPS